MLTAPEGCAARERGDTSPWTLFMMKPSAPNERPCTCMLTPLAEHRWDYTTAAHLMNRAGFSGTPAEIEQLLALGLRESVARFVDYENTPDSVSPPEWAVP